MKVLLKHKRIFRVIIILSSIACLVCAVSAAEPEENPTLLDLENFPMAQNSILAYFFRQAGWLIVKFLRWVVNALETSIESIMSVFSNFKIDEQFKVLSDKMHDLILLLFVLMLVYLAFEYMIKKQNINQHVTNLFIGFLVFTAITWAVPSLYSITYGAIYKVKGDVSVADQMTAECITDNLLYNDHFLKKPNETKDNVNPKNKLFNEDAKTPEEKQDNLKAMDSVDVGEVIDPNGKDPNGNQLKEPYGKYIYRDEYGNKILKDIDKGPGFKDWRPFEILGNQYYRWNVDWFSLIISLIILAFTLAIMSVKIVRLIYELVIHQFMAQALALLDIHSGQRLKKCLQSLIASCVTLFGCFLLLQIYIAGQGFIINSNFNSDFKIDMMARIICMLGLSISVIDGPNVFEQIIGVDAGLNNTTAAILGAHGIMAGARALGRGVKGLGHAATGAVSGAKKAAGMAGKAGGSAAGYFAGKKAAADGMNALPFAQQEEQQSEGANKEGADDEKKEYLSDKDKDKNTDKDKETAEKPKLKETVGRRAPKTIGDHVKSYAKEKIAGENTAIGQAKRSYNLTKEAALHSANKKSYIANKTKELKEQNVSHPKREAKKDYKDKMDKHFGG